MSRVITVGVVRRSRPVLVVAHIEARVLQAELERRLGAVVLDLRVEGDPIGPWRSLATAPWPGGVDATVELGDLTVEGGSLCALFGRTVDDTAAEVRRRMLAHLGVLPDEPFTLDDAFVAQLPQPVRPTDLWLLAQEAREIAVGDPAVAALTAPPGDPTVDGIDRAFDRVADAIREQAGDQTDETIASLLREVRMLQTELATARGKLQRNAVEADERIAELEAERAVLERRVERAALAEEGRTVR